MSKTFLPFIVLNGSRSGIHNFMKNTPNLYMNYNIMTHTTEEELYNLQNKYHTESYYFYDSVDMKGKKNYDAECPNMTLYDDYIGVVESKD